MMAYMTALATAALVAGGDSRIVQCLRFPLSLVVKRFPLGIDKYCYACMLLLEFN